MNWLDFAEQSEFYFNPKTGRYHHRQSKRMVPRKTILEMMQQAINSQKGEMAGLADRLNAGDISLRQMQEESARLLRQIHMQQAALGRGGLDQLTAADHQQIADGLKIQFYAGRDQSGRPFGLRWLADAVRQSLVTVGQLRNSLRLYAESGKEIFHKMERVANQVGGRSYAQRVLGEKDHCKRCVQLASLPPQPSGEVTLPPHGCEGGNNCGCSVIYLTLAEAIERGAKA